MSNVGRVRVFEHNKSNETEWVQLGQDLYGDAQMIVDYEIIGTPVVGSPVSIDLAITSLFGDEPVDLAFRIPDTTALTMDAAQPRDLRRTPSSDDRTIRERVTVIPQREGRLFINVSASRTDDAGSLTSAISIPLHVGNVDTSVREQGELQTNEDGETTRVLTSD